MHLNVFAESLDATDMTAGDEFSSLLQSAADLGVTHAPGVRYLSRNTVARHRRMHFLEWGDPAAPPLLLLHGGHQSAHSWDLVSLHLADRFRIYALDQRGHGDSEWARDGDYSTAAMASDALAFCEQLGIQRPLIFGHSMGGMVTMAILKRQPHFALGAVLVDVGPEVSEEGTLAIRSFIQSAGEFDDLEAFVERVRAYDPFRSREHIERTVRYNMMLRVDGKYVSKCDQLGRARGRDGAAPIRPVSLEDAAQFSVPVLVVRGERSNILAPDAAVRFAEAIPGGQLVTVPECGHNVHSQNTTGFLEAITPFLANLP